MFFWYLGATVALVRYAFRDEKMDLRPLLVGALLPDLVDKPLAAIWYADLGASRLVGHSLLFAAAVMTLVVLTTRRGRPRKRWMPLAVGVLVHLFLAFTWSSPETLWWPFLGWDFTPEAAATFGEAIGAVLGSPWRWAGEVVGVAYLGWLFRRGGLGDAERRREFLTTGRIGVPIERT